MSAQFQLACDDLERGAEELLNSVRAVRLLGKIGGVHGSLAMYEAIKHIAAKGQEFVDHLDVAQKAWEASREAKS